MDDKDAVDPLWAGGAMAVAGGLFIVLGVLVVLYDLPTPGGNVYGSKLQSTILMFMTGGMLLLAGHHNLRGARKGGTETLSPRGPIDGDDGPSGAG